MSLHLVTGYAGREHVTSADHGSFNIAFVGAGEYVFDRGQKFAASIIDNNTVDVADGDILMQGRHIRQIENHVTRLTFENGERGFYRNDLVVAEYRKDPETFVESATLKVIKGTQTDNAENVTDPEHTHADITEATGAILNQMPLYRVKFTGFEITAVERLFEYLPSVQHVLDSMWDDIREIPTQAEEYFESEKARFTSEINAAEAQFLQDLNNTEVSNRQAFQTWFDTIKVILDGDVAGHLQNEIDGLSSNLIKLDNGFYDWNGFIVSTPGGGCFFNQSIPVMPEQTLNISSLRYFDGTWHEGNIEPPYNYGNLKCPRCTRIDEHNDVVRFARVQFTLS